MYSIEVVVMAYVSKRSQVSMFDQMLFPNDIEGVLMEMQFSTDMLAHAGEFRQKVLMSGFVPSDKHSATWRRPVNVERVILVVGQVESDPSLKHGVQSIRSNLGLLQAVCHANADAYIVYKPHPEVYADMQAGAHAYHDLYQWYDELAGDISLRQLLPKVNEVHVMTSLAGFEALLRGKKVSAYGRSFYAGWGLTNDLVSMPSRPRQLSMDELVAGAFFSLPRYMNRLAGKSYKADEQSQGVYRPWRAEQSLAAARA
jgi:capsular polysaccharide export protein